MSQSTISQIERGAGFPSYTTLIRLAVALEVTIWDLFSKSDDDRLLERALRRVTGCER